MLIFLIFILVVASLFVAVTACALDSNPNRDRYKQDILRCLQDHGPQRIGELYDNLSLYRPEVSISATMDAEAELFREGRVIRKLRNKQVTSYLPDQVDSK